MLLKTNIGIDELKVDNSIKLFFKDCIDKDDFPNMLLYGNPGTGKTTTSSVIVNAYFNHKTSGSGSGSGGDCNPDLRQELERNVLIMNASVYRNTNDFFNTINGFAEGSSMFFSDNVYKKFVLLDEIDYMTSQGQRCLIAMLKKYSNVVFICMCNYLSKLIDEMVDYLLVFNYNCFGSLVKTHLTVDGCVDEDATDTLTATILNYFLSDSDIREYGNERRRMDALSKDDKLKIINAIERSTVNKCDLHEIEKMTGVKVDKIQSIIHLHQNVL